VTSFVTSYAVYLVSQSAGRASSWCRALQAAFAAIAENKYLASSDTDAA
jgi:hypothetical protein